MTKELLELIKALRAQICSSKSTQLPPHVQDAINQVDYSLVELEFNLNELDNGC